ARLGASSICAAVFVFAPVADDPRQVPDVADLACWRRARRIPGAPPAVDPDIAQSCRLRSRDVELRRIADVDSVARLGLGQREGSLEDAGVRLGHSKLSRD